MRARATEDRGFTLIELLIAVAITGFIAAAIGGSFLVFMENEERSGDQQAIARDQFSLTSWFLADAQSSTAEDTTDSATSTCIGVPAEDPATSRNVVQLRWTDEATPDYEANYRAERASLSDPWRLVRYFCETGQPASDVVVMQELSLSPAPSFTENRGRLTLQVTSAFEGNPPLRAVGTRHAVVVPDVSGLDPGEAAQAISDAGLTPVTELEPSDTVPEDDVIELDPMPPATIGLGSPVTIVVSSGEFDCALGSLLPDPIEVDGTTLDGAQNADLSLTGDCSAVDSVQLLIDKDGAGGIDQPGEDHGLMTMSGGPNNWTVALTDGGWDDSVGSVNVEIVLNNDDGDPLDTITTSVAID